MNIPHEPNKWHTLHIFKPNTNKVNALLILTKREFPYWRIMLFVLVKLLELLHSTAVSIVLPAANGSFVFKRFCVQPVRIDKYTIQQIPSGYFPEIERQMQIGMWISSYCTFQCPLQRNTRLSIHIHFNSFAKGLISTHMLALKLQCNNKKKNKPEKTKKQNQ